MSEPIKNVNLTIKTGTVLKVVGLVLAMLLAVKFVQDITPLLSILAASVLLAVALNPLVTKIGRFLSLKIGV